MKRLIALILVAAMAAAGMLPVIAEEQPGVRIVLEDVTATDTTTLAGEAKIKVSVEGVTGGVSVAQLNMAFEGDLQYKSITYLTGSNNPAEGCALISPNAAVANAQKRVMPSIISMKTPLPFSGKTELFILTFSGEAGGAVTLRLNDLSNSYFTVDGEDIAPSETSEIAGVTASSSGNTGKEATVKVTLDKVADFAAATENGEYASSGLELKITGENGYEIYTVLNNVPITKGGHRDASVTIPTFTISNTVVDGAPYTVELSGIGYVPYKATGVLFDEPLKISTDEFIPGDVNGDGKVDAVDKQLCQAAVDDPANATDATDFNRDGRTDKYDMQVFDGIADETAVPAKMAAPTVTGGNGRITVTWVKPDDETVTGYTIRYGTSASNLAQTKEITSASSTSDTITGLSAGTTYYVSIAAKNQAGAGAFSDVASGTTNTNTGGTGGPGGSIGGTGGNTGSPGNPGTPGNTGGPGNTGNPSGTDNPGSGTPTSPPSGETFTDLANYDWAKDAIYLLKDRGIISGVSETEYAPGEQIKRGDFILILTRMLDINNAFTENFADVPEGSYYYQAIGSAKAAGVAMGDGGNFMPDDSITRQDLITLAYRAFLERGYIAETTDLSALDVFADRDAISDYAKTAMASMVSSGIIQGSDGYVNPLDNATRAEVAVMCAGLLDLMQ